MSTTKQTKAVMQERVIVPCRSTQNFANPFKGPLKKIIQIWKILRLCFVFGSSGEARIKAQEGNRCDTPNPGGPLTTRQPSEYS